MLESPAVKILIDAGFSGRQISERLASIGVGVADLDAILLTHEHADHIAGLNVLCQKHRVPLFCNRLTREMLAVQLPDYSGWKLFATGEAFELGDLVVESFPLPHDASDPVGFLIHAGPQKVAFVTDLGYVPKLIVERIRQAHVMVLETNHDLELLRNDTRRPWPVKQRILSRHGHLSNEAAAAVLPEVVSENLSHLFLAHLSRDCNDPALALRAVGEKLQKLSADHVDLRVAEQARPAATISW